MADVISEREFSQLVKGSKTAPKPVAKPLPVVDKVGEPKEVAPNPAPKVSDKPEIKVADAAPPPQAGRAEAARSQAGGTEIRSGRRHDRSEARARSDRRSPQEGRSKEEGRGQEGKGEGAKTRRGARKQRSGKKRSGLRKPKSRKRTSSISTGSRPHCSTSARRSARSLPARWSIRRPRSEHLPPMHRSCRKTRSTRFALSSWAAGIRRSASPRPRTSLSS